MTGEDLKLPFYIKVAISVLSLIALLAVCYIAKGILVPIVFALIFAIVLHPVVNFFIRLKISRIIAITITLVIAFIIIVAFGTLLISEISRLSEAWPILVNKFTTLINQTITDASGYFDTDPQQIHAWISKTLDEFINTSGAKIEQTIFILGSWLVILFLLPVYIFLILYYQPILIGFIHTLFGEKHKIKVTQIVSQTKTVIQQYLIGRLIEAFIIATMNTIALLVIGIEYALFLGIIGAIVNIIPFIGGVVSVILPIMVALITKSSPLYAGYVLVAYYFIQLIDNHYIVPIIVSSKVKINALFSIIVVLAGNALWGIPGMFLSIPILAIVKVICDNIDPLKPWGFLLGDSMPKLSEIKNEITKTEEIKQ